jgi:hypothetical protein
MGVLETNKRFVGRGIAVEAGAGPDQKVVE